MIEHHIQIDIVKRLAAAPTLRFSELKPRNIESNIFMYHLKQLMKAEYICKDGPRYTLAQRGLNYVNSLSFTTHRPRLQPVLLSIFALRHREKGWLLAERKLQPHIGSYIFPNGKQHIGESPSEHARREVREKTTHDIPLEYRGFIDIQTTQDAKIISHVAAHVFMGAYDKELPADTSKFHWLWWNKNVEASRLLPGTQELRKALESSEQSFMLELTKNVA